MAHSFQAVRDVLETVDAGVCRAQGGPLWAQLVALGLLSPEAHAPAPSDTARHVLTPDGKDVLDALRSEQRWAEVEQVATRQGIDLSLETLKAAVAAALTGGFNA